jgi:hypothetical protein
VIVKALQDWRPYLADTEKPIQIYTDHKNLRNFATTKQLNQQQVCWAEQLVNYNFKSITRRVMRMVKQTLWVDSLTTKKWKDSHQNSEWRWQGILTKGLAATYKVKQALDRWRTNTSMSQQQGWWTPWSQKNWGPHTKKAQYQWP